MVLKIGHRGAKGYEPENTLRSFEKALGLGVDMVEFDVHLCKSGEVVVIHDAKLNRTTNGKGKVSQKTLQELKDLDAGKNERIPTLEEALDLINRRSKVNIELKGRGTARPTCRIIDEYVKKKEWDYGDFIVSSFNKSELETFSTYNKEVLLNVLYRIIPKNFAQYAQSIGAYSVALLYRKTTIKHITEAHDRGLKVLVWTVNKQEQIRRFRALGIDGIVTDFPDLLTKEI